MNEKDIAEKALMACNDVFADVINVIVFGGKRVVEEASLSDATTNSMYKVDKDLHEQNRDVAKYWKDNEVRISFFGLWYQETMVVSNNLERMPS